MKRKGRTCNDLYALTQDGAAKLAAKEFNCSLQQLRLQQPPKRKRQAKQTPRQYRFVYYDTRDKHWRVRRKGLVLAGSFKTELAAAKFAAKAFGETLTTLRLGLRRCVNMHTQVTRFRDLWAIYRGTSADHPSLPGDLQDLLQRTKVVHLLRRHPGLIVPFLLAKFAMHRNVLLDVASKVPKPSGGTNTDTQTKWLHQVLQRAVSQLRLLRLPAAWIKNVGRNSCHHSGLIQFADHSLGRLESTAKVAKKLRSLVLFGEQLLRTAPTTNLEEWVHTVKSLQEGISQLSVAGFARASCYRALWTIRLWLLWRMRSAGCLRLRLDKTCSVLKFMAAFPDQRRWGQRMARGLCLTRGAKIAKLFDLVGYDGPPELFSMFTCLFGDKQLNATLAAKSPTWLTQEHDMLSKALLRYRREHSIAPHPAVLVLTTTCDSGDR